MKLRGHAEFITLVGKSGGPSPWWLALIAGAGLACELLQVLR